MPLRVRVTTTTGGAAALQWLGTYCSLALLFDGKREVTKNEPPVVEVDVSFPKAKAGADYMKLLTAMNSSPLEAQGKPVVRVEEVP